VELRCVLLHEIGHIRRGDLLWQWIFQIARAVHWFNPLVWVAGYVARGDAEMACDEWVLAKGRGMDSGIYGEAILRAARRIGMSRVSSAAHAGMAESRRGLSRRIRHLAGVRARGLWASLAALGFGMMVFFLVAPAKGDPAAQVKPEENRTTFQKNSEMGAAQAQQVEIESKFVELTPEAADEVLRVKASDGQAILEPEKYQDLIRRLNGVKGADLLSAPKVSVKSGRKAIVRIVREFSYPTGFKPPKGDVTVATPTAFEVKNLGLTLTVEPTVTAGGRILCTLEPEVVEFLGFINYGASHPGRSSSHGDALDQALAPGTETDQVINQPVFRTRRVQTVVSLRSGQTVLFGGLTRHDKQAGTDLAGRELERNEKEVERVLYVFVTARLLDASGVSIPTSLADAKGAPSPTPFASPTPVQPQKVGTLYGTPVPNKPGFITSPYAPKNGYVDVRGFPPGTEVKCPYTGRMFLVP
jgi:hypothetical protein